MPSIPVTSDTAILQRFFDLTGENPNAVLSKAMSAHVALVEDLVPQASARRAAAEAEMETARRTALGGDIEAIYKAAASGDSFDDIRLGDNPLKVAEERLEAARRLKVTQVGAGDRGAILWELTESGIRYIRELLDLPDQGVEIKHKATTLEALCRRIADDVVRGYVEEAVLCLKAGALRAAVVFLWAGTIRHLQDAALDTHGVTSVSAALQKHDPKARRVSRSADFANVKDTVALLAFRELGIIDKGQWQTLEEALGLRNRSGHPTRYKPGLAKVSAFVEDVVGIAFL